MSIQLLQRLSASGVVNVLETCAGHPLSPQISRTLIAQRSATLSYGASGGHKDPTATVAIGDRLREIAREAGFPNKVSSAAYAKFDRMASIHLATAPELDSGEALRDDVWAYIATVVVPDVVEWRFPDRAPERFSGGVRNAIQRLWVRGVVLDRGVGNHQRWELVERLKEDAAVQIFERPGIFGQGVLARSLAEGYVRALGEGKQGVEGIMRRATKILRLRNEVYDLAGMAPDELDRVVLECFAIAEQASGA